MHYWTIKLQPAIFLCLNTGPDPGRCNRCKCIGQKKNAVAFIGQIFIVNNEKQHSLRKHKAYSAQISTKLVFPRNEDETYSQIYI